MRGETDKRMGSGDIGGVVQIDTRRVGGVVQIDTKEGYEEWFK